MILWVRARRIGWLAVVLVTMLVVGFVAGAQVLTVPLLFGHGANNLLLTGLLPVAWAAAIADAFAGRGLSVENRPVLLDGAPWSRLGVLDAVLFLSASAVTAASYGLFVVLGGPVLAGVGPVLILSGVACIGTVRAGPGPAMLTATSLLLLTTMYGLTAPAGRYVRVLQPDGSTAWSMTVGLVLCAVACWLLLTDRTVTRLRTTERLD